MMVGLYGQGKTTTCGKLAKFFKKKGLRPVLIAGDVHRPAAFEQLKQEDILLDHKGELETFEVVFDENKLSSVFESVAKSLEYYEKGETKDSEEKKEKSKDKEKTK